MRIGRASSCLLRPEPGPDDCTDNGSAGQRGLRRATPRMSAARKKPQLSRHARGYINAHVARRRQLEPLVATGQVSC